MFTIFIVKLQAEDNSVLGMMWFQDTKLMKIKILNKKSSMAQILLILSICNTDTPK